MQGGGNESAKTAAIEALAAAKSINILNVISRAEAMAMVALALAQTEQSEAAKTVIGETLSLIPKLRDDRRSSAYSKIAQALARLHDYRLAREMALNCSSSDDKVLAYTVILREYAIDKKKISPKLFEQLDRENEKENR